MASTKITINARRVETSAAILPDGTLVRWFWVEKIQFRDYRVDDWQAREAMQSSCYLSVSTRYNEQDGYVPLLKGATVYAVFNDLGNGSTNTKNKGLAVGSIRVRNPKLGSLNFTTMEGLSGDMTVMRASQAFPVFSQIAESGEYSGHKVTKLVRKGEAVKAGKRVAA